MSPKVSQEGPDTQTGADLVRSLHRGLFLKILEPAFDPSVKSTAECKRLFEGKYLGEDEKLDPEKYSKIFSFEFLESRRRQVQELDIIIILMTEKR